MCKPFTVSPARVEANRRNAQKSSGPRTARGKLQSRLDALREGGRSPLFPDLVLALLHAAPADADDAFAFWENTALGHDLYEKKGT